MRSRRTKLIAITLFVVALAGASALIAPEAQAIGNCHCGPQKDTNVDWGRGYTCTQATNNLKTRLDSQVFCAFGLCSKTLVITSECHAYSATQVEVDGYYHYICQVCLD